MAKTPDTGRTVRESLAWAVTVHKLERLPGAPFAWCGHTALQKAAADLRDDEWFPEGDAAYVAAAHNAWDGLMTTMFGRYRAGLFLRWAAGYMPPAARAPLERAADRLDRVMGGPAQLVPALNTETTKASFSERSVRHDHAERLLEIATIESEAMDMINEALAVP